MPHCQEGRSTYTCQQWNLFTVTWGTKDQGGQQMEWMSKLLLQTVKDFFQDSSPHWAAAIAYYCLLSLFPLMLAAAVIATFFVNQDWAIRQATQLVGNYLPGGAEQIREIVTSTIDQRRGVGIISLLMLLWSGSRVFGVTVKALNIAYHVDLDYGFFKRVLIELLMTVTLGLLLVVALSSRFALRMLWEYYGKNLPFSRPVFQAGLAIIPTLLLIVTFFLVYQVVPRRRVDWKPALIGALSATILFMVARPLFIRYVTQFANYNLVYGPLAIMIILVLWAWLSALILLLGGELVSHLQDVWIEKATLEHVSRQHKVHSPIEGDPLIPRRSV